MSAGKGVSEFSYTKHQLLDRLVKGQWARASRFLGPGDRIAIIDMHAGDARGVESNISDLFLGAESQATPVIAAKYANLARKHGLICDLIFCERSRISRERLTAFAAANGATIFRNHELVAEHDFLCVKWALILNDPNGPSDHGDDALQDIANRCRRADFLIVVNEGACLRIAGVSGAVVGTNAPSWTTDPARLAAVKAKHEWRLSPAEWGRRLLRNSVLASRNTFGDRAMKGRILLVSNAPQTTPVGFDIIRTDNASCSAARSSPEKPAHRVA